MYPFSPQNEHLCHYQFWQHVSNYDSDQSSVRTEYISN